MRRFRVVLLMLVGSLSGCTLAIGDDSGCGGSPWVFGITAKNRKAEPIVVCDSKE